MTSAGSTIVGISAHFHDAACCLVRNGSLIAAVQEERLTRSKHDPSTPVRAFRECLGHAGADITDIDCVAYHEVPALKRERILADAASSGRPFVEIDPVRRLRSRLGYEGEIRCFGHHRCHAASAYYASGYDNSAVLTVDGVGEWTTMAYWEGGRNGLKLLEDVKYPDSLGLLYSTLTAYLGFAVNDGEYKVMGLAAYGRPCLVDKLRRLVSCADGGQFSLDPQYFTFRSTEHMYSDALEMLLGHPPRHADEALCDFHADLASSVQTLLEEILLAKVRYLKAITRSDSLCLAGGVALNCVANGRIRREGPFERIFVPPAVDDAGCALGAAALAYSELHPAMAFGLELNGGFLGKAYEPSAIRAILMSTTISYREFPENDDLVEETASRLASGSAIGWFVGRMEFGPRALGGRSILADPRDPRIRDRINAVVKRREPFRPFAPAVLSDCAGIFFDPAHESPFMAETRGVRPGADLPAVTHVDQSARLQTVDRASAHPFAKLLCAFERLTSCPVLLNTSFNMSDEPIVCTPEDALTCFFRSELDALVIENFLVDRDAVPVGVIQAVRRAFVPPPVAVSHNTYTLV